VAHEIRPIWHLRMQAAFQKHTENAVSKTINLPSSAKPNDIQKIYEKAYELNCKGITVFRDKSKKAQVLTSGIGSEPNNSRASRRVLNKDLLEAVDWLLDDHIDQSRVRKRASISLASLSRSQLKRKI